MDISNEIESNGKTYEMLWDCKFCGTHKLLGKTHRFCPNCGGQQDPSWRYFPADNEKVAVENHVYVGADFVCKACHALNGAKCEYCGSCGAPLSEAAHAKQGATRAKEEGQSFATEDLKQRQQAEQAAPLAAMDKDSRSKSSRLKVIVIGVLIVIAMTIYAFTRTEVTTVIVTGFKWQRSIGIEMMQAVPGRTECGNQPGDAYNISQHYEQVGTRQVPDGETCQTRQIDQGDGTFREQQECHTRYRSEAVMGYMCSYVVNRWAPINAALSSGDKTAAPYWPVTNINSNAGCLVLGCKRETQRNEQYMLLLKSEKNRDYECAVSHELWDRSTEGESFRIKVGSLLHHAKCDTLTEK
jgi:hypothetical protein